MNQNLPLRNDLIKRWIHWNYFYLFIWVWTNNQSNQPTNQTNKQASQINPIRAKPKPKPKPKPTNQPTSNQSLIHIFASSFLFLLFLLRFQGLTNWIVGNKRKFRKVLVIVQTASFGWTPSFKYVKSMSHLFFKLVG